MGHFDSAMNKTHMARPAHNRENFSDAAKNGVKSDAKMDSGSYHMKHNPIPMLLSEQTFKGKEQELSDFANRVATRHSIGDSAFGTALSPTNDYET